MITRPGPAEVCVCARQREPLTPGNPRCHSRASVSWFGARCSLDSHQLKAKTDRSASFDSMKQLFAFAHFSSHPQKSESGWNVYSVQREFERQVLYNMHFFSYCDMNEREFHHRNGVSLQSTATMKCATPTLRNSLFLPQYRIKS